MIMDLERHMFRRRAPATNRTKHHQPPMMLAFSSRVSPVSSSLFPRVKDIQIQDQVLVERLFAGKLLVDGLFADKVPSAEGRCSTWLLLT